MFSELGDKHLWQHSEMKPGEFSCSAIADPPSVKFPNSFSHLAEHFVILNEVPEVLGRALGGERSSISCITKTLGLG